MKINPLTEAFRFMGLRTANGSKDRDPAGNQHDPQRQHPEPRPQEGEEAASAAETFEVTDENVLAAVVAFGVEAQAHANGLAANVLGQGPGIRVVLSDANGATLRQLSGEEFLRLRASAKEDRCARGKLLDRKF